MELVVNNLPANKGGTRDKASLPGLGRSPGEENGNPLQYSCLDRGVWQATVQSRKKLDITKAIEHGHRQSSSKQTNSPA